MEPRTIYLDDRRVRLANRMDLLGHATAAFGLFVSAAGLLPVHGAGETALVAIEFVSALALSVAVIRELRSGDADESGISWINLFACIVLLVDWWIAWRAGGKLLSPTLLSAVVAAGLTVAQPAVQRRQRERRMLRIDDDQVELRTGRFRRLNAPWRELRAVTVDGRTLRFRMADGERAVSLAAVRNRDDVVDALRAAARARGIPVDAAGRAESAEFLGSAPPAKRPSR